ncbi:hypothetical protein [Criblamydia sequanensis]|uniref:Uncharacterized protein n=1 Tax=Candidatus Criblamydia sequanensis CRIB-18 TaxID=1437425 RepID=A0A090D328_9BACT|nr:hypothetical protein [Criblamydia sequanensis]CDR34873.1 hypothetical protein CSEC_2067 [Criblamydia sequanensis CRIB-18]
MNVVFHSLTLGIPLAIYRIVSCSTLKPSTRPETLNLQTTAINSIRLKEPASNFNQETENNMKEEIAAKITERYQEILNFIGKTFESPLCKDMVLNQLDCLALEINTLWTNHSLKSLSESGIGISREKALEVLDSFVEKFPQLQRVKETLSDD